MVLPVTCTSFQDFPYMEISNFWKELMDIVIELMYSIPRFFIYQLATVSWRNASPFSIFVSAALPPGLPSTPPLRWHPPGGTMGSIKTMGKSWETGMENGGELWLNYGSTKNWNTKRENVWFTYGSTMIS